MKLDRAQGGCRLPERKERMKREYMTDEQVEQEIERLLESDHVKLSKHEQQVKNRRRQYMYQLRWHEKRGRELLASGITEEVLNRMEKELEDE